MIFSRVCFWQLHIEFRLKFKKKLRWILINKHITIWLRNSLGPSSQIGVQIIKLGFVQHLEKCFNMSFTIFRKTKSNFAIVWLSLVPLVPLLKGFCTSLILRIKFKSTKIKANRSKISWNEFIGTDFTRCSGDMFAKFHDFFGWTCFDHYWWLKRSNKQHYSLVVFLRAGRYSISWPCVLVHNVVIKEYLTLRFYVWQKYCEINLLLIDCTNSFYESLRVDIHFFHTVISLLRK